jgi:hypothetical protein
MVHIQAAACLALYFTRLWHTTPGVSVLTDVTLISPHSTFVCNFSYQQSKLITPQKGKFLTVDATEFPVQAKSRGPYLIVGL